MINFGHIQMLAASFLESEPFPHIVVDNFFEESVARALADEFPKFDDEIWFEYQNAIELKKASNNWNAFPKNTYTAFQLLNSADFCEFLSRELYGSSILFPDPGLHGGGWHIHGVGGKLNTHLDYSLHPKMSLQRRVNIIVYMNPDWRTDWGGQLGLWGNASEKVPGKLEKSIVPLFNRAVIFDTTCNSWHGLPEPISCPPNQYRKSIAVYYLCEPEGDVSSRGRALFAPTQEQKSDKEVLELIKKRSSNSSAHEVYRFGSK